MVTSKLVYNVKDRPKFKNLLLYSFQLLLAILAATVAVPSLIGLPSQIPSAILGAGVGTIVYILFTKGKSPIVVSSSFAYLAAFPAALAFGYLGVLLGAIFCGSIYILIAIIAKFAGTRWINRLLPPVIIGPVVALIGLSLAGSAMTNIVSANASSNFNAYNLIGLLCGLITFVVVVICSTQMKSQSLKLIPFIIGIIVGYFVASIFTAIGNANNIDYLKIINWDPLVNNFKAVSWQSFIKVPHISLAEGIKEVINGGPSNEFILEQAQFYFQSNPEWFNGVAPTLNNIAAAKEGLIQGGVFIGGLTGAGVGAIALAFCPIALVSFAEHLADHKNMSRIIDHDLLNDPGLTRTLLGDGVGSIAGTAIGICPNTSYGEGIACVALTKNASVITTFTTACICILLSFIAPFAIALQTIPSCVMGGVCLALYGFISVSGLRMFKDVDFDNSTNLLTICSILIAGIGSLVIRIPLQFTGEGKIAAEIEIGAIATAMLIGIMTYQIAKYISGRSQVKVKEVYEEAIQEDYVRVYLKQFDTDKLAKAILIFGFMHETVDLTAAQLSNFLRSEEMLNARSQPELVELVQLFDLKGYKKGMKKTQLVRLIREDCQNIDRKMKPVITGVGKH